MSQNEIGTQETQQQPLISFVITTNNLPIETLRECIDSVMKLSLSKQEREIILVDDGSDASVITELYDIIDNILYVRQSYKGLSAARNIGIRMSTGKYIQLMCGDDSLVRSPYEHCLDIIRFHDADIVTFNLTNKKTVSTPFELPAPISGTAYLHDYSINGYACSYIFRRITLGSLRFRQASVYAEDEEFTPQLLLRAERVFNTDALAYYCNEHKNMMAVKADTKSVKQRIEDMESVIFRLQKYSYSIPDTDRRALERRIAQLSMDCLHNVMCMTRSIHSFNETKERLREHSLFPLPDVNISKKYSLFRRLSNSGYGRMILFMTCTKGKTK